MSYKLRSVAISRRRATDISGADMRLRVADDGRGFDPSAARGTKTFGLLGMRERAATANGEFQVTSTPGAGTMIEMVVPLQR